MLKEQGPSCINHLTLTFQFIWSILQVNNLVVKAFKVYYEHKREKVVKKTNLYSALNYMDGWMMGTILL